MNKRISNVEISINKIKTVRIEDATQGDKNTHFLGLTFTDEIELTGYELQVYYLPPFPATVPFVDTFKDLQKSMEVVIPDVALERNGEVTVEFALSKDNELITINRNLTFEVRKTTNGSSINAYVEGNLKETIADQIKRIELLMSQSEKQINEHVANSKTKIDEHIYLTAKEEAGKYFDSASKIKIDDYVTEKKAELKGEKGDPAIQPDFTIRDKHLIMTLKEEKI